MPLPMPPIDGFACHLARGSMLWVSNSVRRPVRAEARGIGTGVTAPTTLEVEFFANSSGGYGGCEGRHLTLKARLDDALRVKYVSRENRPVYFRCKAREDLSQQISPEFDCNGLSARCARRCSAINSESEVWAAPGL